MIDQYYLRTSTFSRYIQSTDGLFNHFINHQNLQVKWSKIEPVNRDGGDHRPGQRGGHQMVLDPTTGLSGTPPHQPLTRSDVATYQSYTYRLNTRCCLCSLRCTRQHLHSSVYCFRYFLPTPYYVAQGLTHNIYAVHR